MTETRQRSGRIHDAQGAREAILDAAEKVFAEHGFDGTRVDVIAAESSYNKGLLFRYFGSKLDLYAAVIRRADEQTRLLQEQSLAPLLDRAAGLDAERLRDLLRTYLQAYFDYLLAHPRIARIYLWEMAEGWKTYARIVSERDFEEVHHLKPLLNRLQNAGLVRPDLDAFFQLITTEVYCLSYLACLPLAGLFSPDEDFTSPKAISRARDFNAAFISQGLILDPSNEGDSR